MNTEAPQFEAKKGTSLQPEKIKITTIEGTFYPNQDSQIVSKVVETLLDDVAGKPRENQVAAKETSEPTESQKFWRKMYQTGELSPYKKDRGPIKFDALKEAVSHAFDYPANFVYHFGDHVRAVDKDFRGGVDIGGAKERVQRAAVMAGSIVPAMAFDIVTSIPSSLISEYAALRSDKHSRFQKGVLAGLTKMIEVENDKLVTALGDLGVSKLTGEKGPWTREASDKSADLLQTAFDDRLKDSINGPVLESIMRIVYQVPIGGALWERFWTNLTFLQEKSPVHKGIGKSIYMGIGMAIGVHREVKNTQKNPKISPSAQASQWVWKQLGVT